MTQPLEFDGNSTPTYCLFRAARAGQGNIAGDPKFMNPAAGDYRLKPDSPAIDAGKRQNDLPADRTGIQRGLNATSTPRGDGSHTDIGAEEALPKPVAIWLPNGGPPGGANEGQTLDVAWQMDPSAGTGIRLTLFQSQYQLCDLGQFSAASGSAVSRVRLPFHLNTGADYRIQGVSVVGAHASDTALFKITGSPLNAVSYYDWGRYH